MIHGAGAVDPVKALEHVFAFLRRERLAGRCYAQSGFVVPGLFQRYADRTGGGIFDGIIQQDLRALPEMLRAAPHRDAGFNIGLKRQAIFKEQRFKRQHGVLHQRTPVERLKYFFHRAVIHSRKLQKVFHQPTHLVGHGEDALGKTLPLRLGIRRITEHFRVREDHGERRFQLVRGVGNELLLLRPCPFHRLHRPARQKKADGEKNRRGA